MKHAASIIVLGTLLAGSACHTLERSREVDNPAVAGKTIAMQICSNCHGMTGVSVSPFFPKLAGQQREYIVDQLTDFKNHRRTDPNGVKFMWGFTHLSERQINEIADYFSSQQPALGKADDDQLISEGRAIYAHGLPDKGVAACQSCHGQRGEGEGAFPRLAGQHSDYVVKQLMVFRHTDARPRGAIMKEICANMTEREMQAVAAYVEAFPAETKEAVSTPDAEKEAVATPDAQ
ncbi:cytochrome C signal peptide protein [Pandoraea terrae]|uniref:Cytochrome C signal peptide protein n=1 Tax=Pandoraea terrae TaxID=1537710 RepID=A0A5E4SR99_9BURK|nr:c-type cytochrome [Pandoraea terrae]VVD76824.1 cytochrome C signal peptide protein [Pandoraea terrae]